MTTPAVDVVIVSYNARELLRRCLASLREHAPAAPVTTWVVDNGSTDGTVEMVGREFPGVELIAADQQPRLRGGEQRRDPARIGAVRPRAQPGHPSDSRSPRPHARAHGVGRLDRDRRLPPRARGRHVRPRGTPLVPHAAQRTRPLHGRRAERASSRRARRLPCAVGRARAGRRRQRRVHALPAAGARRSRPLRRGLLDVHGRPGHLLPLRAVGLDHLVRARRHGRARQGRHERQVQAAAPRLCVPLRDAALLSGSTTQRVAARSSTCRSTPRSPSSSLSRSRRMPFGDGGSPENERARQRPRALLPTMLTSWSVPSRDFSRARGASSKSCC